MPSGYDVLADQPKLVYPFLSTLLKAMVNLLKKIKLDSIILLVALFVLLFLMLLILCKFLILNNGKKENFCYVVFFLCFLKML